MYLYVYIDEKFKHSYNHLCFLCYLFFVLFSDFSDFSVFVFEAIESVRDVIMLCFYLIAVAYVGLDYWLVWVADFYIGLLGELQPQHDKFEASIKRISNWTAKLRRLATP